MSGRRKVLLPPPNTAESMRIFRVLAIAVLGLSALLVLGYSVWSAQERARDPLAAIHRPAGEVRTLLDSTYAGLTAGGEPRVFRDLVLETAGAGTVRVTTSRPALDPGTPLPLVFVLAGLRTGRESLAYLDQHGPNLLVGYEYPYDQRTFKEGRRVAQVPAVRQAVLDVPAQVTLVADLLRGEGSVDPGRTALLGFSLGALFVPAVQRVAAEEGRPFHAVILAYGGADISSLLHANLRVRPRALRRGLIATGATLVHPMEAAHHLPRVPGQFLLIRGEDDHQIPIAAAERMAELTPYPKEVVVLAAGHMGPRDLELTARVVTISQDWLVRTGVIEPPTAAAAP
jgi:dienelactone hydrolase